MRRLLVALIAAAAALALIAATARAARQPPSVGVNFVVQTTVPDTGPAYGPFTASGLAVDAGFVCPSGQTIDLTSRAIAVGTGALNVQVTKQFTCDDNSGTFDVKLSVRIDKNGDNFHWTIVGGTGAYTALHGSGDGFGIGAGPSSVTDYYSGIVR